MGTDVHYAASRYNTFLDSCTGSRESIIDTVFLLFHLNLGSSTYIQLCYTAGEFSQTLLQFLFVVGGFGSSDLCLDLLSACIDCLFGTCTVYDSGVVLAYRYGLGGTEHLDSCLVEFDTFLLADYRSAGEDRNILEHLFAAVTEARSFYGAYLQLRAKTVDNKSRQRFAVHILGDNQ